MTTHYYMYLTPKIVMQIDKKSVSREIFRYQWKLPYKALNEFTWICIIKVKTYCIMNWAIFEKLQYPSGNSEFLVHGLEYLVVVVFTKKMDFKPKIYNSQNNPKYDIGCKEFLSSLSITIGFSKNK